MKKLLLSFLLLILLAQVVIAHPGSLDENGGHYNRKTGEYHYHEGTHTESNSNSLQNSSSSYKRSFNKKIPTIPYKDKTITESAEKMSEPKATSYDKKGSYLSSIGLGGWIIISILFISLICGLIYDAKSTLSAIILLPFTVIMLYVSIFGELLWEMLKSIYIFIKKHLPNKK